MFKYCNDGSRLHLLDVIVTKRVSSNLTWTSLELLEDIYRARIILLGIRFLKDRIFSYLFSALVIYIYTLCVSFPPQNVIIVTSHYFLFLLGV